jgi:xanthine dehydrogenase accessory factor
VYEIALTVAACRRADTRVDVAWLVDAEGFGDREPTEAVALTPGGGRVGALLAGCLDDQLADVAGRMGDTGRFVTLAVADYEAAVADLPSGGTARCLVVPADQLPGDLWELLLARRPIALVTQLDGDRVLGTTRASPDALAEADEDIARAVGREASATQVQDDRVVTLLFPVPKLVIVGGGPHADALEAAAELLGWQVRIVNETGTATGLVATMAPMDKLVVMAHDLELAGPVLAAALDGEVGYIGALGSRRTQEARAEWLAYRGVTDLERIHGPAGLDIGATTPPEIAVSILAEALATGP